TAMVLTLLQAEKQTLVNEMSVLYPSLKSINESAPPVSELHRRTQLLAESWASLGVTDTIELVEEKESGKEMDELYSHKVSSLLTTTEFHCSLKMSPGSMIT